jgi:Family of unknown function (DUF5686)/CarboxypepD_reg-like domain
MFKKPKISVLLRTHFLCAFFLLTITAFAQKATIVRGRVTDEKGKEALPYVNVQFEGTSIGATSDIDGNFYLETKTPVSKVKVSYVGFRTQTVAINQGQMNEISVKLVEGSNDLQEVVVKVERYRNKGNPAVELIKKVIDNKEKNRKSGFNSYQYNKYEKVEFALNGISDSFRNNRFMKKVDFVFQNADTNKASGKVNLPFFLRERLSDLYYRKDPKAEKELVRGERTTKMPETIDDIGISGYISNLYQEVDIYSNNIELVRVNFVSPLNPIAPTIYRFYIQDTSMMNGANCVHLYFAPRNKMDLAFIGHMWVSLDDDSYAVRKIEMGVPKDINLNFIREMEVRQEFDWVESPNTEGGGTSRGLMLSKDVALMDFAVTKGGQKSVMGTKTVSFKDYKINQPISNEVFNGANKVIMVGEAKKLDDTFWAENRHDTLNKHEKGIFQTMDSLNKSKPYRRFVWWSHLIGAGYGLAGPVDIGPVTSVFSFNPVEGYRVRLGGRTNLKFSERILLEGYAAYGTRDKRVKHYVGARFILGGKATDRDSLTQVRVWHQNDIRIPGQDLLFIQEDGIFASFRRGLNNKMFYQRVAGIEFQKLGNGVTYTFGLKSTATSPSDLLEFNRIKGDNSLQKIEQIQSTELGFSVRYAPNEIVYQGAKGRRTLRSKYPVVQMWYGYGVKDFLGGEYEYHNVRLKAKKTFYLPPAGFADVTVEGGKIFGQLPYSLLTAHRANQLYYNILDSYNLMNFLEFVSDQYASVNVYYNMGGFMFNRIPLIRQLKWRETITVKAVWGSLDSKNVPSKENGLLQFAKDADGNPYTHSLEKAPYVEVAFGVSNIFKLLHIDYVRRLNYLNLPNVDKWGIRARIAVTF